MPAAATTATAEYEPSRHTYTYAHWRPQSVAEKDIQQVRARHKFVSVRRGPFGRHIFRAERDCAPPPPRKPRLDPAELSAALLHCYNAQEQLFRKNSGLI